MQDDFTRGAVTTSLITVILIFIVWGVTGKFSVKENVETAICEGAK